MIHTPVLLEEVIEYLNISPDSKIIDATLNGGGHSRGILERYPTAQVIGIEYDPDIFQAFQTSDIADRVTAVNDSYANLGRIAEHYHFKPDAILFDLGVSSHHYLSGRGFTFQGDEPLDMRFNPRLQTETASDIINRSSRAELERVLSGYGEEEFSSQIAEAIVKRRSAQPVITSGALVEIILGAVPSWYRRRKIHPATKTFQALRMAVNRELETIQTGLRSAVDSLVSGGRLAIISFHGVEDKLVREFIKSETAAGRLEWVVRSTVRPKWSEVSENIRARSAKMKVAKKV